MSTNTAPKESEKTAVAARMPNAASRPRPGGVGSTHGAAPCPDLVLDLLTAGEATHGPLHDQSTFATPDREGTPENPSAPTLRAAHDAGDQERRSDEGRVGGDAEEHPAGGLDVLVEAGRMLDGDVRVAEAPLDPTRVVDARRYRRHAAAGRPPGPPHSWRA